MTNNVELKARRQALSEAVTLLCRPSPKTHFPTGNEVVYLSNLFFDFLMGTEEVSGSPELPVERYAESGDISQEDDALLVAAEQLGIDLRLRDE